MRHIGVCIERTAGVEGRLRKYLVPRDIHGQKRRRVFANALDGHGMMEERIQQELLQALREIRDGQKEIISLLSAQRALAEEQVKRSRQSVQESIGLQKLALRRQRSITLIAVPGILACIAAIAYLVIRYF